MNIFAKFVCQFFHISYLLSVVFCFFCSNFKLCFWIFKNVIFSLFLQHFLFFSFLFAFQIFLISLFVVMENRAFILQCVFNVCYIGWTEHVFSSTYNHTVLPIISSTWQPPNLILDKFPLCQKKKHLISMMKMTFLWDTITHSWPMCHGENWGYSGSRDSRLFKTGWFGNHVSFWGGGNHTPHLVGS